MEKDNKIKNKRNFIIIGIIMLVIIGVISAILLNKNKVINIGNNYNKNVVDNKQNNIFNSSKITWVRNESLKTDSNASDEENTVKTTNVNINSLTKITLREFANKCTENSETNFVSVLPLENVVEFSEIKKDEVLWSTRDFYIKGVLPGFEMRLTAKHPDYLDEDFFGVNKKDISVGDFIITNIQFEGNMNHLQESYLVSIGKVQRDADDSFYLSDMYDAFSRIDPETRRTSEEIIDQTINSIEQVMSWIYKDYHFSDEIKTDLHTILNCMYFDTSKYSIDTYKITYKHTEDYVNDILSIKWQNEDIENRHEIYVNTDNDKELFIR